MIEINTYLDGGEYENENIPYEEFTGRLCEYLDGAIEIIVNGSLFFREEDEFIHVSWTNILYRLLEYLAKEGRPVQDTPLVEDALSCLHFDTVGNDMLKVSHPYYETEVLFDEENFPCHRVTDEGVKVVIVNTEEFLKILAIEGWKFFHKFSELKPEERTNLENEEINWLEKILCSLGIDTATIR